MIAIVDYGVGNLFSLSSSVRSLGAEVRVTRDAADLRAADHILLPGVGAFADAMAKLEATGLVPVREADPLFKYVKTGEYVYYVHSYYAKNCAASTLATSDYSIPVTGAVRQGLVYGTQFHPEKSGDTGLRLLKAFAEL